MTHLFRLWVLALSNPLAVFWFIRRDVIAMAKFTWWTSLVLYLIAYYSLFSLILGFNSLNVGGFVFLLAFFLMVTFTMVKNYFYTLMISYKKGVLVSYQDISLISTLSDLPMLIGLPLLYAISNFINGGILLILTIIFLIFLIRNRSQLLFFVYQVPTRFVFTVSLGLWAGVFAIILFFCIYLGITLQVALSTILG